MEQASLTHTKPPSAGLFCKLGAYSRRVSVSSWCRQSSNFIAAGQASRFLFHSTTWMTVLHQELPCSSRLVGITWPSQFKTVSRSSRTAKTEQLIGVPSRRQTNMHIINTAVSLIVFLCVNFAYRLFSAVKCCRVSKSRDRRSASDTPHRLWSTSNYGKDLNEDKTVVTEDFLKGQRCK